MPQICAIHSFINAVADCKPLGGVKAVKYQKGSDINLVTANASIATYFDVATYTMIQALPSSVTTYKELKPDNTEARFDSNSPDNRNDYDVSVTGLRFKQLLNPKELNEAMRVGWVVAYVLCNSGDIICLGLNYDTYDMKLAAPTTDPLSMSGTTITSDVQGSETGILSTVSLAGKQDVPYLKCSFNWTTLTV